MYVSSIQHKNKNQKTKMTVISIEENHSKDYYFSQVHFHMILFDKFKL